MSNKLARTKMRKNRFMHEKTTQQLSAKLSSTQNLEVFVDSRIEDSHPPLLIGIFPKVEDLYVNTINKKLKLNTPNKNQIIK